MKSNNIGMPWALVLAGCFGFFAATATGSTRAPFLPDMAADLNVSLPAIANLFGVTAASWGFAAYLVGRISDRIGRKVFIVGAPAGIAILMFLASKVDSYEAMVLIVALTSMCCGSFTASVLAEVSLRAHPSFHGRAFGYVMTGQSLTLLFGVPAAAWLGSIVGWRGTHVALAVLAACALVAMVVALRIQKPIEVDDSKSKAEPTTLREALTGPIIRLFLSLITERLCFGLAAFYYAAYLRTAYSLPIEAVALPLVIFALGNILGTLIGGQVADRFPYRRVSFAVGLTGAGIVALPWFMWQPGLWFTVALGSAFGFFTAAARPSLLAALADVPPDIRGTVMGLNSAIASIGWLTAALVGGWFYAGIGFHAFGPLMAVMCLAGALIVLRDSRVRQRHLS